MQMLMASQFKVGISWKIAESFVIDPIALVISTCCYPESYTSLCSRRRELSVSCRKSAANRLREKLSQILTSPDSKEQVRYNEYYSGVHVLSGRTGKLNKKTSTLLLCLARCLITQAIKYLVNITEMAEVFAEAFKTTTESLDPTSVSRKHCRYFRDGSELEHDIPGYL